MGGMAQKMGLGGLGGGMMPGGMGGMPDLSKMDPKQLEALQKQAQAAGLGNGLPKGLPGMPGGGLPSLPGGLKLPGLPGGPKKKPLAMFRSDFGITLSKRNPARFVRRVLFTFLFDFNGSFQ